MIDSPPAIYNHPFPGQVIIDDHYGGEISAWDGPCFPFMGAWACAKRVGNVCYVWAMKGKLSSDVLWHEIGHCNGWAGDHPRG